MGWQNEGDANAQANLGVIYVKRLGRDKKIRFSSLWFKLASGKWQ